MLSKKFDFLKREDALYQQWEESGLFSPSSSPSTKKSFCIAMPPPNANGSLHLGHASMLAYEDIMVRFHRMQGDATLWIPGTDHAGIQTQVVFERYLQKNKGKTRHDLGREEFYKQCYEFCMNNKETITGQVRKMGASCDWTREQFTLNPELLETVIDTFIQMYNDGLVYRAERIINWCPRCGTALSDIEVLHEDTNTKLYTLQYGPLTLATVRPETKFGDTALAVHPDDARYQQYIGKTITVDSILDTPVTINVIADDAVDPSFGTGVIKVTPAHDPLDFEIGERHHLEIRQVIDKEGKLTKHAGIFAGRVAREAREDIVRQLQEKGLLKNVEDYVSPVSVCERCKTPIEPQISLQWWIDMKEMAKRAVNVVKSGEVDILPKRFEKEFYHWLEQLRDWNISRQIWWGPRLPIWYCDECDHIHVQKNAPAQCAACNSSNLRQDTDTFDTWFSSAQWPYSILGGLNGKDFAQFYPTNVMETGWDILFFWVARMLMVGLYRTEKIPFHTVYLHGLVLDEHGKKMSKSKGNVIDPLAMISKYGTDALRLSMVAGTTPGQNVRLYEEKVASFRNFQTKLWNIGKYIEMKNNGKNLCDFSDDHLLSRNNDLNSIADRWILSRLQHVIDQTTTYIESFQFGQAIDTLYHFLWHDFADWYIEISKALLQHDEQKRQDHTLSVLIYVFRTILHLLHPFAPFITEELWQQCFTRPSISEQPSFLMSSSWPKEVPEWRYEEHEVTFQMFQQIVRNIRECRTLYSIPDSEPLSLIISAKQLQGKGIIEHALREGKEFGLLEKIVNVSSVTNENTLPPSSYPFIIGGVSMCIPLQQIDTASVIKKLTKDIERDTQAISRYQQKLSNTQFVSNAPTAIIDETTKKLELREEERTRKEHALRNIS